MAPKIFGLEHILFIIAFILLATAATTLFYKYCKTEERKNKFILVLAATLFASIVWNRISIAVVAQRVSYLIPNSFCGATSFYFSLSTLVFKNKSREFFHCFVYIAFVGGIIAVIYPDFIGQADSIWYSKTISGLIHHALAFYLALMMLLSKTFKPSLKKWWCLPVGMSVYMAYGLFLNQALDANNSMNIDKALVPNTFLTWYNVGFLLIIVQITFLIIYTKLSNKKASKGALHN